MSLFHFLLTLCIKIGFHVNFQELSIKFYSKQNLKFYNKQNDGNLILKGL